MIAPKGFWLLGPALIGLGLYLRLRPRGPNAWVGVRLPWTFADREIWDKSWKLGADFLILMGAAALLGVKPFFLVVSLMVLGCLIYPWRLYHRKYGTSTACRGRGWTDYRPLVACRHCGHRQCLERGTPVQTVLCEACGLPCRT